MPGKLKVNYSHLYGSIHCIVFTPPVPNLVGMMVQCHHSDMSHRLALTLHPKSLAALLGLLAFTLTTFAYTVHVRRPWYGKLSFEHHQWLTANTLRFAHAWYAESPWMLRFALLNEPQSAEFPTLLSRNPYVSYPPGFVLTAYAYSLVTEGSPTIQSLMSWNLINHGLIAVTLGSLSLLILRRLGFDRSPATLLAAVPPTLELLLPGPLYWHQNVYFADQAVLLPYILFILLESIRDAYPSTRTRSDWWQALTMAWGLACDWLFVCLVTVVYVKRLATGDIPRPWSQTKTWCLSSLRFGIGGLVVLGLFFIQLAFLGMLPRLKSRFLERIGATDINADFTARFNAIFWGEYIPAQFGAAGPTLAFLALVGCLALGLWQWRQMTRTPSPLPGVALSIWTMVLLTVPCFLQVYALRNYSAIHDFSALKFSLVIAAVPFVLLPATLLTSLAPRWSTTPSRQAGIATVLLTAALVYLLPTHLGFRALFPEPSPIIEPLGNAVRQAVTPSDIVFSPDFEIPTDPPHLLALAGKRVYYAPSLAAIAADVARYPTSNYNVVLLFLRPLDADWERELAGAQGVMVSGLLLYRFDAKTFADLSQRATPRPESPPMPALSGEYRWDVEGVFRLFPRVSTP